MTALKSFTDIPQSKKLAEILPLESADMCYLPTHIGDEHHFIASLSPYSVCTKMTDVSIEYCTPCWSLAALLGVLPYFPDLSKHTDDKWYITTYHNDIHTCLKAYDTPVDACVAMIGKLHELKML